MLLVSVSGSVFPYLCSNTRVNMLFLCTLLEVYSASEAGPTVSGSAHAASSSESRTTSDPSTGGEIFIATTKQQI